MARISAEYMACWMHESYELNAIRAGYKTRKASRGRWEDVPKANKDTMILTCQEFLDRFTVTRKPRKYKEEP